jgi:hypothetical protein
MTFWQENFPFVKDVYLMRNTKMTEWMENLEKAICRIMADKVYTSAEFKRERDNFHVRANHKIDNNIWKEVLPPSLQCNTFTLYPLCPRVDFIK